MSYIYCPACGCRLLDIEVSTLARVEYSEDDSEDHEVHECPVGEIEWGTDWRTTCTDCGKTGTWFDFYHEALYSPN